MSGEALLQSIDSGDIDRVYKMRKEALLQAIDSGNIDGVYKLIWTGMNLNFAAGEPLKRAMESNNYEILKLLILNGANIFFKNSHAEDDAAFFAQQIDDEIDLLPPEERNSHPYIIYLNKKGYGTEYSLSDFIYELDQLYLEYVINKYESRLLKIYNKHKLSKRRKEGLHNVMAPSQSSKNPQYSNPAHAVLSQQGLLDIITKNLNNQWGAGKRHHKKY